jgi:arylsulfatase A-like enzyme
MGRDHNHWGFTVWLAGGGVRGGQAIGATDDFGYRAVEQPVHVHDLHATLLHLLGFDHTQLTYRYAGRDFRLTDVRGEVIDQVLA